MTQDPGRKEQIKTAKSHGAAIRKTVEELGKTSEMVRQGAETLHKAAEGAALRGDSIEAKQGEEKQERRRALSTYRRISRTLGRLAEDCEASRAALLEANVLLEKDSPVKATEGLEQLKQRFLQRLGHDLKTPLTSIKGSQDLLKSGVVGKLSEEAIEMVDITERNTNRLITLVDQIMELEKAGMGQEGMKKSVLSLENILQRAVRELVLNLTGGQAEVSVFSHLADVYGNEETLVHIMGDLMVYALGLPPKPGRVVVWTEDQPEGVKVCIRAQGKRLQPEILDRVFHPFSESNGDSETHHFSGTGLEMAVCRAIVAEHAGQIGVDNHPEGCVFWFTLPKQAVTQPL